MKKVAFINSFAYLCVIKSKAREPGAGLESGQERKPRSLWDSRERLKIYHIKVDWETLQIIMKYRDKLSHPMAGPNLFGGALMPGGLQRKASTQNLSIRSFIASFGVGFIKEVSPAGFTSFLFTDGLQKRHKVATFADRNRAYGVIGSRVRLRI